MVGFVGAAIDYSRANKVKAAIQTALDTTALMLSKEAATDTTTTADQRRQVFQCPFAPHRRRQRHDQRELHDGRRLEGHGQRPGQRADRFVGILGVKFTIWTSRPRGWGSIRLRVALVLDNTGSMADAGKLTALKTATKTC